MAFQLSGATRLNFIVGDPIAQVKSPAGVTAAFAVRGHDGLLAPVQVSAEDLAAFLDSCDRLKNLDGIIVTVPHKFACFKHCVTATERARFLGACNIMRRSAAGGWHGEAMADGSVSWARCAGRAMTRRAVGRCWSGRAARARRSRWRSWRPGVRELSIHDAEPNRRDSLIARLNALGKPP